MEPQKEEEMNPIDAGKIYEHLEQVGALYPRFADNIVDNAVSNVINDIKTFIASLRQEQTNAYDVAMLEVKEYVDKLYDDASIGLNEYDSGLYNGIVETCMKLRGFIKARTSKEQPEVDLENYISGKLRELGADLINHKPYSFNRGLNVGKANAYNDILGRLKARKGDTK